MEEESIFSPRIKYTEHRNLTLAQAHHSHSPDLIPLSWPSPRTLAAVLEYLAAELETPHGTNDYHIASLFHMDPGILVSGHGCGINDCPSKVDLAVRTKHLSDINVAATIHKMLIYPTAKRSPEHPLFRARGWSMLSGDRKSCREYEDGVPASREIWFSAMANQIAVTVRKMLNISTPSYVAQMVFMQRER